MNRVGAKRINEYTNILSCCDGFQYLLSISQYDGLFTDNNQMQIENDKDFLIETVRANIKVIAKASRWDLLLIKGLRISKLSPLLNSGFAYTTKPQLF